MPQRNATEIRAFALRMLGIAMAELTDGKRTTVPDGIPNDGLHRNRKPSRHNFMIAIDVGDREKGFTFGGSCLVEVCDQRMLPVSGTITFSATPGNTEFPSWFSPELLGAHQFVLNEVYGEITCDFTHHAPATS